MNIRVYSNSDVLKIVAFIPPGHRHMRLAVFLKDQVIVLQEASVAAIARAYLEITAHPTRKAIEYVQRKLDKETRKPGYAEYQLLETSKTEEEIVREIQGILGDNA